MNLQHDSYLSEYRRREQLADIERRWQVVDWARTQAKRPFLHHIHHHLHLLGQIRHIRIQVTFELKPPCPEPAP